MILTIILLIVSFAAKAVKDTLQFHFNSSIFTDLNKRYWDPKGSWMNKYDKKDMFKPRFWGSTHIFSFLTDGWHLFQFIMLNSIFLSLAINIEEYQWIINFIGIRVIYAIVFNLFFDKILIKK